MLSQIKEARRTRQLQHAGRRKRVGLEGEISATIAVVGYTNSVSVPKEFPLETNCFLVYFLTIFYLLLLGKIDSDK